MRSCLVALVVSCALVATPALADGTSAEQLQLAAAPQPDGMAPLAAEPVATRAEPFWFPWEGMLIGGGVGFAAGFLYTTVSCDPSGLLPCGLVLSTVIGLYWAVPGALLGMGVQLLARVIASNTTSRGPLGAVAPEPFILPTITVGETNSLGLTFRF